MQGLRNRWGIAAAQESAYGTAAAAATKSHPFTGAPPRIPSTTITDADRLTGVREEGIDSVVAGKKMEFSPEFDAHPDLVALYFKYALGSINTTGATVPYTHVLTVNQTDIPSFTGFWKGDDGQFLYPGCKVKSLTIKGAKGGGLSISVSIIGNGVETADVSTFPGITRELLIPFSALKTFTWGGTDLKKRLQGFELTVENTLDDSNEYSGGGVTLDELEAGPVKISGKLDFKHKDRTLIADALAQTNRALILEFEPNANNNIKIDLPRVFLDVAEVGGGKTKLTHSPSFRAYYDPTTSKAIEVTVKNATASYAA